MLLGNAVKFAQMPFCLIPKVLYPIDVVLPFGKVCTVVDAQVAKLTDIQHIIALNSNLYKRCCQALPAHG